jgi:glycosyltransferase involved in cell wall biosynthesis
LHRNATGSRQRARPNPPQSTSRDCLIVVPVRFHRIASSRVAVESAFCEHLRALRDSLSPTFAHITVASPAMVPADYERDRDHLGVIEEDDDGIRWVALQPGNAGRLAFWLRHFAGVFRRLWREVRRADLVHAGTSHDVYRPIEITALLLGMLFLKKTICVVDIDLRDEARMNHRTGRLGRKSLFLCWSVYDPLRSFQLHIAARWCSLVLLKGRRLCRDYGRGRAHVKYILESAFSAEQIISPQALADKAEALADPARPLELVYFGRLTAYKGIDRCIAAVATSSEQCAAPLRLTIIGAGEELANLRALCNQLGVEHVVEFHPALPYGPRLFEALEPRHLLLAAPLSEDTPRSALDAMASGIPILAFATEYYTSLAESGAVDLVPWPSVEHMAERIAYFAQNKHCLQPLALASVEFARANTQQIWMRARAQWTLALFDPRPGRTEEGGRSEPWEPAEDI